MPFEEDATGRKFLKNSIDIYRSSICPSFLSLSLPNPTNANDLVYLFILLQLNFVDITVS